MELHFVRTRSLISKAITAFEGGQASHVGVAFDQLGEPQAVIDSSWAGNGVRMWHAADWFARYDLVETIGLPLRDEAAARSFLQEQLYKPYDLSALVGFLAWRDWSHDRAWYCSELAGAAMLAGGATLADRHRRLGVRLLREVAHARSAGWAAGLSVAGGA